MRRCSSAFRMPAPTLAGPAKPRLVSPWLAPQGCRLDVPRALRLRRVSSARPIVRTAISRTVIDVNRDPSGASLYPGQATTDLCPTDDLRRRTALSRRRSSPSPDEIERGAALFRSLSRGAARAKLTRLQRAHARVVLYDCHSIRSYVPRLFDGELPQFNIGTNDGTTCDPAAEQQRSSPSARQSGFSHVAQRPLQGRLDHAPLRADPQTASTPSRWSSPCRGYLREPPGDISPATGHRLRPGIRRAAAQRPARDPASAASPSAIRPEPQEARMTRIDNSRASSAPPRHRAYRQELADRGAAADADEQSRSRRRRAARGAGRLWRHRPRRARLGKLRPDRRDAASGSRATRRCWSSPASRSACSARTRMRRACCSPIPTSCRTGRLGSISTSSIRKGLMMYGQMTAGSWIYIGTQGIVQGTYETFVEMGRQHYGGNLAGKWILTAGLGGMGGAQPLAATMAGAQLPRDRVPASRHRYAPAHRLSRRMPRTTIDEALAIIEARERPARRSRSACSAMPPRCCPNWSAAASAPMR